jgi:hypothetical protein
MLSRAIGCSPDAPQAVPLGDKARSGGLTLVFLPIKHGRGAGFPTRINFCLLERFFVHSASARTVDFHRCPFALLVDTIFSKPKHFLQMSLPAAYANRVNPWFVVQMQ